MKKDVQITTQAFVNLFSKEQSEQAALNEFRAEDDDDVIFKHLHFAEQIFPDGGIMLCPVSHAKSKYVGINCERIFGHRHDSLRKMSLSDFFELVHPEDLPPVRQCFGFIKGLQPYDPSTHRFTMRYRIKNADGNYVHIQNENLAIETSTRTYLHLMVFTNLASNHKFFHVTLDVFKKVKGNFIRSYSYNPKQTERAITPRQNDIARLILRGFSNQEIADQLRVSIFTVKNHKKMLFKKVNVKNSIELANYVRQISH